MDKSNWELGVPNILKTGYGHGAGMGMGMGLLGTMDIWAALIGSFVYTSLTTDTPTFLTKSKSGNSNTMSMLVKHLPIPDGILTGLQTPQHARSTVVLIMASLFFARVITKSIIDSTNSNPRPLKTKTQIKKDRMNVKTAIQSDEIDTYIQEIEAKERQIGNTEISTSGKNTPRKRKGNTPISTPKKGGLGL